MIFLYNVLMVVTAPIWGLWMWWRTRQRKEAPIWGERFGNYRLGPPEKGRKRVWFHAVSVGEVIAAVPILRALRETAPQAEIVLTVTTSSGYQTAAERAEGLFDHLHYAPIDLPRSVWGTFLSFRAKALVIMETELWPNMLWFAKELGVPALLVNGRISDRSFPRYRGLRFFVSTMTRRLTRALMQSETDAARMKELGAPNVEVMGNCKYDQALEGLDADPAHWRQELHLGDAPVLVIGSTRGEEEEAFVAAALAPLVGDDLKVVWAPRHVERADAIAARLSEWGDVGRRSQGTYGRITLLDTFGELSQVYAVADVVVIGGGFAKLGGQNLIQPLAHGKPVVHGPHMANFRDVSEEARRAGATAIATTPEELTAHIKALLADEAKRKEMGAKAHELVARNQGASQRYAQAIAEAITASE